MTTGGAIPIDTVANFLVGASSDIVEIDLSDLNGLVGTMQLSGDGASVLAADATPTVTSITATASFDLGAVATSDIANLAGATAFTTSTLETAIEAYGLSGGVTTSGDGILVTYDDNVNSYLAYVTINTGKADGALLTDVTVTNILQLTGVTNSALLVSSNLVIVS